MKCCISFFTRTFEVCFKFQPPPHSKDMSEFSEQNETEKNFLDKNKDGHH